LKTPLSQAVGLAIFSLTSLSLVNTQAADNLIEEITVTAQKREQSLQDVPISLQVVNDEFINDIAADNISDISQFVPGLDVSAGSPTQPRYTIRGIQTSDFGIGTDPAVGVYVDGIYSARSGAAVLSLGDIERIEVLKGPQGTLFGRNSAAGAVSVITKKPISKDEGSVGLRLGNFGKKRFDLMLNKSLGDNLAIRFNALSNTRDGLYEDADTGQELAIEKNFAARAALRWDISDRTNATLTWTHDDLDQDARVAIGVLPIPTVPTTPTLPVNPADFISPFDAEIRNDVRNNRETRELNEVSLSVNHEINDIQFTSISSWRQFDTENLEDEDGTNRIDLYFDTNNREDNESVYQELRLASETGPLNWLLGTSYFQENASQISDTFTFTDSVNTTLGNVFGFTPFSDLENGLLIPNNIPFTLLGHGWREAIFNEGDFSAFAVFADAIWAVTDRANITLGGRYTKDDKQFSWFNGPREAPELDATLQTLDGLGLLALAGVSPANFQFDFVFDQSGLAGLPCDNGVTVAEGVTCTLDRSYTNFSPRAVIDYKLSDNVLAFASYAKGYKAGGFNSVQFASEFENEDVSNIELGIKSELPNQNLMLNASIFSYEYNDKQSIRLSTPAGSSIPQYLVETSDDEAWGADFYANWTPTDNFSFFANTQYIDATFKNRTLQNGTNLSGEPTGEPKLSTAFGVSYQRETASGSLLAFKLAHSYRGKTRTNSESLAQGAISATTAFKTGEAQNRTDVRVNWINPSDAYEIGIYANNVFDEQYVTGVNNITADTLGTPFVGITDPRTFGIDFKARF